MLDRKRDVYLFIYVKFQQIARCETKNFGGAPLTY